MKMLITTVALAAVLATPALSQTTQISRSSAHTIHMRTPATNANPNDYQSQARVRPSVAPRNDVYDVRGAYVGSDPDPLVRDQLRRDPGQGNE